MCCFAINGDNIATCFFIRLDIHDWKASSISLGFKREITRAIVSCLGMPASKSRYWCNQSNFIWPKFSISSYPSKPDITAVIERRIISRRLCFLQRSIRGSEIESEYFKNVALIYIIIGLIVSIWRSDRYLEESSFIMILPCDDWLLLQWFIATKLGLLFWMGSNPLHLLNHYLSYLPSKYS